MQYVCKQDFVRFCDGRPLSRRAKDDNGCGTIVCYPDHLLLTAADDVQLLQRCCGQACAVKRKCDAEIVDPYAAVDSQKCEYLAIGREYHVMARGGIRHAELRRNACREYPPL